MNSISQHSILMRGCEVRTPYGWGFVLEYNEETSHVSVGLDEWGVHGQNLKFLPVLHTQRDQLLNESFCPIGSCVYTKYGTGIVLEFIRKSCMYVVRLWNAEGGQGSAISYMPQSDLMKILVSAVGLHVDTPFGKGCVLQYRYEDDIYVVRLPFGIAHLNKQSLQSSPNTKFIPAASYLVWLASENLQSHRGSLSSLVRLLRSVQEGNVPLDTSLLNLTKYLGKSDPFFEAQRGKVASLLVDVRTRILAVGSTSSSSSSSSTIQSLTATATELSEAAGGKIYKLAIDKLDVLINKLQTPILDDNQNDNYSGESLTDIFNLLIGNQSQSTSSSNKNNPSNQDAAAVNTSASTVSNASSTDITTSNNRNSKDFDTDNLQQLIFSTIQELTTNDPELSIMVNTLRDIHRVWSNKLEELRKLSQTVSFMLNSSKSIGILSSGGEKLRGRIANLVGSSRSSGDSLDLSHVLDTIPGILEQKLKPGERTKKTLEKLQDRVVSNVNSNVNNVSEMVKDISSSTENNSIFSLSFVDSLISKALSNWGVQSSFSSFKSSQFIIVALMRSFQDGVAAALSNSWRVQAESRLCSILADMNAHESIADNKLSNISGFELRRRFINPLHGALSLSLSGVYNAANFSEDTSAVFDPISAFAKQVGLTKDITFDGALSMARDALDGDALEGMARKLVKAGDAVVTSMETLRNNEAVQQAITQFKSGDLGATLASSVKDFELDNVIAMAEDVFTDAEARAALIDRVKDQVLDFLLQYIPTLSLPDLDGVKDDVEYSILGLDLSRFKFTKEGVSVEIGQIGSGGLDSVKKGSDIFSFQAKGIEAKFMGLKWRFAQTYFPHLKGDGLADAIVENASIRIGFKIVRVPKGTTSILASSTEGSSKLYEKFPQLIQYVMETRQGNNSNSTDNANDNNNSNLNGTTFNNANNYSSSSSDSHNIWGDEVEEWEPALVVSNCWIAIENLNLVVENNSFSWFFNLLASVFSSVIKEYVCVSLKDMILSSSASLLGVVNGAVGEYWPMIKKILDVQLDMLPIASPKDVAALLGPVPESNSEWDFVLKFVDEGSLGLKLDVRKPIEDASDPSSLEFSLVIVGAILGSQSEQILADLDLAPEHVCGAVVRSVNGRVLSGMTVEEGLLMLRGARPLSVAIRLSKVCHEARMLQRLSSTPSSSGRGTIQSSLSLNSRSLQQPSRRALQALQVRFLDGPLGLKLKDTKSCGGAIIITAFARGPNEELLQAESFGTLKIGMIVLAIGNRIVFGQSGNDVMDMLKNGVRPLDIIFVPSPDEQVVFNTIEQVKGLQIERIEANIMVSSFASSSSSSSSAAAAGANNNNTGNTQGEVEDADNLTRKRVLKPGSVILRVNKTPVTTDLNAEDVQHLIVGEMPSKVAVRDMDSFIHLLNLRDGKETLRNVVY